MFKYWHKVDALNHLNRLLLAGCGVLLLIVIFLCLTIMQMPKRFEFWLSPQIRSDGGLIKPDAISQEYVQGFVATLIPTLHTWSKGGKKEFAENMSAFSYYFTPRFQTLLKKIYQSHDQTQFFNRIQTASLYRFMQAEDVKQLSHNSWEVHLLLRLTQRLSDKSPMVISDKVIDYHFRVVKVNISPLANPFQLALDGYTKPETLVEDLLVKDIPGAQDD